MLFSELNRINLNVLIQDSPHETVPDISSCYVHNAEDWTIFCNELFDNPDQTEVQIPNDNKSIVPGWNVTELSCTKEEVEQTYLYRALTDISNSLLVATDISSDLVKVYAGEFAADGTVDYDAIINADGVFENIDSRDPKCEHPGTFYRSWWTFNNGAFQWIGGPKSIFECRYSYGPFNCPHQAQFHRPPQFPPHDPNHEETNHKMLDHVHEFVFLPNLIFVFNEWHVLKGIVSLPCINTELVEITKNYLTNFLRYAQEHFSELTFKNIDNVIRNFGYDYLTVPMIKVARKHLPEELKKPIEAVITFTNMNKVVFIDDFNYILSNMNDFPTFFNKSCWKNYYILDSMHIGKTVIPTVNRLTYDDTNVFKIIDTINDLSKMTEIVYYSLVENNRYTLLSTSYLAKPRKNFSTTSLMTIADLFKHAKEINNLNFDESNTCIVVLPEGFCTSDDFKFIANVKYL